MNGTDLTITFNQEIIPRHKDHWLVSMTDAADQVYSGQGAINGKVLTLTLASAAASDDTGTIEYRVQAAEFGSGAGIKDLAGNVMASWSAARPVTNNTP